VAADWRDPRTGRAVSFEQFARLADTVANDLRDARIKEAATLDRTMRARTPAASRRAYAAHTTARSELQRQQILQQKIDAQLNKGGGPPKGPTAVEWEVGLDYDTRQHEVSVNLRFWREDHRPMDRSEASMTFRLWRRDGRWPAGYGSSGVDWQTPNGREGSESGGGAAVDAFHALFMSTELREIRLNPVA
jgi:hypothetical protein